MDDNFVIKAENLTKTYQMGEVEVQALRGATLTVQPGELLAEVILPGPGAGQCGTYLKYRKRGALDFPIVGVAAVITKETAASRLRIAVTGVGSSPSLVVPPADFPAETALTHEMVDRMAEIARKQVKPVSHMEVSPSYRKELVGVLVRDALEKLAGD